MDVVEVSNSQNSLVSSLLMIHGLSSDDFYVLCNGKIAYPSDAVRTECVYRLVPRLPGGKGGFGSMLRALGAQIEKTTNREACRDLSGRRMRDVNNEKKLREWAAKASEREKAREEKRRERRERLIAAAAARHKFSDPDYDQQKANIAENLDEAIWEGLQKAGTSSHQDGMSTCQGSRKRKAAPATITSPKQAKDWIGADVDLSSSDSDSETKCRPGTSNVEDSSSSGESSVSVDALPSTSTSSQQSDDASSQCCSAAAMSSSAAGPSAESTTTVGNDGVSQEVNLDDYSSAVELEKLGMETLKLALMNRGLKCGGTLQQRAERLFSVKGLTVDQIDKSLFAKPVTKKA